MVGRRASLRDPPTTSHSTTRLYTVLRAASQPTLQPALPSTLTFHAEPNVSGRARLFEGDKWRHSIIN
ncbi:hypothetical protein LDENG_00182400 [Lucifuga dentata]|nr:hypothetical protein LDENG_00182400 [Lucifuga dentata]